MSAKVARRIRQFTARTLKAQLTAAALMILMLSAIDARGQGQTNAARPDRGTTPVGSYSVSDIEAISLSNGNLHLSIPLASLPPIAGGKLGLSLGAHYNSKLWDMARLEHAPRRFGFPSFVQDVPQLSPDGGWRIEGAYSIDFRDSRDDYRWLTPPTSDPEYDLLTQNTFVKVVLTTPDGATHELRPLDYAPYQMTRQYLWGYYKETPDTISPLGQMRYYSFDGSYLWARIYPTGNALRWELYLPGGSRVVQRSNGVQRIWDSTGLNVIKIYSESDPINPAWTTTHFVDQQTGREIKHVFDSAGEHVQYQTAGGGWASIDIVSGSTTVSGKTYTLEDQFFSSGEACERQQLLGAPVPVIRDIILPSTEPGQPGRSFHFSYTSDANPVSYSQTWKSSCEDTDQTIDTASPGWGELSQMVTPTGATVNYTYNLDSVHKLAPDTFENNELPRGKLVTKSITHDGITDVWNYNIGVVSGSATGPDGSTTTETFYNHDPAYSFVYGGPDGLGGLVYRTNHSNKIIVERHWSLKKFAGANDVMPSSGIHPPFNTVVDSEYTTVVDPANSANNKMSARLYQYDYNGNLTQETDYDWFNANTVTRDSYDVPTGVPGGVPVLRVSTTSYYNPAPVASDPGSGNVYAKRLLATATPLILNAPQQATTGPSQARFSYDSQSYGMAPTGGLLTKEEHWDDGTASGGTAHWVAAATHTYDATYGNLLTTTTPSSVTPNGNVTTLAYDTLTHAQPISVTVDPLNGTGQQTTQTTYDFSTGLVLTQTDANGNVTSFDYTNQRTNTVDPFHRPGVVTGPAVSSSFFDISGNYTTVANQHRKVVTRYFDSNGSPNNAPQVEVWSDLKQQGDALLKNRTTSDQLGRPVLSGSSENGSTYTISSRSVYQQMGRISFSSNPTRGTGESTDGWTRTTRDDAGRVIEVASFNGAAQPPPSGTNSNWTGSVTTSYNAEQTTVTDQAGKSRGSIVDGLGRLKTVVEDPNGLNHQTSYTYDALSNLTQVNQGVQVRQFAYDSLSRLKTAKNPEQVNGSGTMIATAFSI